MEEFGAFMFLISRSAALKGDTSISIPPKARRTPNNANGQHYPLLHTHIESRGITDACLYTISMSSSRNAIPAPMYISSSVLLDTHVFIYKAALGSSFLLLSSLPCW